MSRLPALITALLLPVAQPLILGTAVTTGSLLVYPVPAQAQTAESVAKIAQAITVRIEGATQGSGVLVKRDGNRYTVLTAWHVVSGQRPGEELDIYTPDGQRHKLEQGSIKRRSEVDMATLSFVSGENYTLAITENSKSVSRGSTIIVAGFPRARKVSIALSEGIVVANADTGIDDGYRLIYTSNTETGMSGGPVLSSLGKLVAIHGRGELDFLASDLTSSTIKTGANQGVPIDFFTTESIAAMTSGIGNPALTSDHYVAEAHSLLISESMDKYSSAHLHTADKLLSKAINIQAASETYLFRASVRFGLNNLKGYMEDLEMAYKLNPNDIRALLAIAQQYKDLGRKEDAYKLLSNLLTNNTKTIPEMYAYSITDLLSSLGATPEALIFLNQAISKNPRSFELLGTRAMIKKEIGDHSGAIADFREASKYGRNHLAETIIIDIIKKTEGLQSAIQYYDVLIEAEPKDSSLYYWRSHYKEEAGDMKGFYDDRIKAFEVSAKKPGDYVNLSNAKLKVRDRSGALMDLQKAALGLTGEKDADAYRTVADAQQEIGDIQGAINTLNLAIQRFPRDQFNYSTRALLRKHKLNDSQGAIEDYMNAAKLSNYDGLSLSHWAEAVKDPYYKDYDKRYIYAAIDVYSTGIARNPREGFSFYRRAKLKAEVGDLHGALGDLNKAVLLDNTYHKDRAEVLLALDRRTEASTDIDQAISRVSMTDAIELAELAEILHSRLGQTQKALALIDKGLERHNNSDYVYHLYLVRAKVKAAAGDAMGACMDHRMVISLDTDNSESREWLKSSRGATCR